MAIRTKFGEEGLRNLSIITIKERAIELNSHILLSIEEQDFFYGIPPCNLLYFLIEAVDEESIDG